MKTWNNIRKLVPIRNFLNKIKEIIPYAKLSWVTIFDDHFTIFSGNIESKLSVIPQNSLQNYLKNLQRDLNAKYPNNIEFINYKQYGFWTDPFVDFTDNQKSVAVKLPLFDTKKKLIGLCRNLY